MTANLKSRRTTFEAWLRATRATDDGAGDLIGDLKRDRDLPWRVATLHDLREHLYDAGACDGAMVVLPKAWERYERWRDEALARSPEPGAAKSEKPTPVGSPA